MKNFFLAAIAAMAVMPLSAQVRGDVTGDGVVDIQDVNEVINIMLGKEAPANENVFTVNGVTFTMVDVEGGEFTMGDSDGEGMWWGDETRHRVVLSGFKIGQTEVTQELWTAVMGTNPSHFKASNRNPVDSVSWDDCREFIAKLNELTGKQFRLPTEAEWEFAARGGVKSNGYKSFSGSDNIEEVAWYFPNSAIDGDHQSHPVATKQPNELGIYDMTGNISEWCNDYYDDNYYSVSPVNDPQGPESGTYRVLRGGSWHNGMSAQLVRVSRRSAKAASYRSFDNGLRLAL